ncbi:hypothetical protein C8R44DRAFT_881866 [Mycena epipterygia]|nr:hypothetical protein C8R44DRAFT_881866 [Mycena epipterygia]
MMFNLILPTLITALAASVIAAPFGVAPALMDKRVEYPREYFAAPQGFAAPAVYGCSGKVSRFKGVDNSTD